MKNIITALLVTMLVMTTSVYAQSGTSDFSREQGYLFRPELYGAILAEFGYQVNPHFQFSLGGGVELAEETAVPELVFGVRTYATDTKWTAFFDYHLGMLLYGVHSLPNHKITAGASYKNLDFGGGIVYINHDGTGVWGPCFTLGYNIRFHK